MAATADILPGLEIPPGDDERPTPRRKIAPIGSELVKRDPETARAVVAEFLESGLSLNAISKRHNVSRDVVAVLVQGMLASMKPDDRARALFARETAIKSKLVETALDLLDNERQVENLGIEGAVNLIKGLSQPPPADGPERQRCGQLQPAADDYVELIESDDGSFTEKKSAGVPEEPLDGSEGADDSRACSVQQSSSYAIGGDSSAAIAISPTNSAADPAEPGSGKDSANARAPGGGGAGGRACAGPRQ